jgi:TrmH family RNA methyltransferase
MVGREASGLPPEIAGEASLLLSIPIRPGMDSVNVAAAATVFLYEVARQRCFRY